MPTRAKYWGHMDGICLKSVLNNCVSKWLISVMKDLGAKQCREKSAHICHGPAVYQA